MHLDLVDFELIIIPKQQDASFGANSRPLSEAGKAMTSKKSGSKIINDFELSFL
jgi:hypothetical protein